MLFPSSDLMDNWSTLVSSLYRTFFFLWPKNLKNCFPPVIKLKKEFVICLISSTPHHKKCFVPKITTMKMLVKCCGLWSVVTEGNRLYYFTVPAQYHTFTLCAHINMLYYEAHWIFTALKVLTEFYWLFILNLTICGWKSV